VGSESDSIEFGTRLFQCVCLPRDESGPIHGEQGDGAQRSQSFDVLQPMVVGLDGRINRVCLRLVLPSSQLVKPDVPARAAVWRAVMTEGRRL
jgi:hypothetical protein